MAIMSTGSFPQDLRPGVRAWFGMSYKNYDAKYDKILDVKVPDDRAYEEDVMSSGLSLAQVKTQGAPTTYDQGNQMWSIRYPHITYSNGFVITQELMEDGIALKKAIMFAESLKLGMLRSREIVAAGVYNGVFSTPTGTEGGDGVSAANSAHPTPGGNFSNVPASPASLSEAALEQMVIDVMAYKDNRGQLIMVRPDKLLINPALQFTAHRMLNSVLRPTTADNDINAIKDMGILPGGVVVNPYLTSLTNWHVRTDQPGALFWNRKDISLDDDNDFDTNNAKFKGVMRISAGITDPRSIYSVNS